MRISRNLNIVIPVEQGDRTLWVHSTPIRREVFEKYWMVIARSFSQIVGLAMGELAGPRVAMLSLRQVAQELRQWDGPEGVEAGLVAEMRRLTNVLVLDNGGWQTIPLQQALDRNLLDKDDAAEVENAVCFFTIYSAMHSRPVLAETMEGVARMWGAQVTSLNVTEYAHSLKT